MQRKKASRSRTLLLALCLGPLSCGSKGAVAVTASIDGPGIAVEQSSALAAKLNGAFMMYLELGSHAPSGTDVTIGSFSLVNHANQATLVQLKFTTGEVTPKPIPGPPYHLEPGGKTLVGFTVSEAPPNAGQVITKTEETALCGAGSMVEITGTIADGTGNIPVSSAPFAVGGCP
jgi:hypothetical protein